MVRVKIASMIYGDLKVFLRDYRSFVLLFITPLVIAGSIGIVYINSQPADIKVMVCTETEKTSFYYSVLELLRDSKMFWITEIEGACNEEISNSIMAAESRLGVIINSYPFYGEPSEYNSTIEVQYDNSKPIGFVIQSHLSMITNQVSKEMINAALGLAHDELTDTLNEVDDTLNSLSGYVEQLKWLRDDIIVARNEIASAKQDIEEIRQAIDDINNLYGPIENLQYIESTIEDAEARIEAVQGYLGILNLSSGEVEPLEDNLNELSSILDEIEGLVISVRSTLQASQNQITDLKVQGIGTALNMIGMAESTLNVVISDFNSLISQMESAVNKIKAKKDYLTGRLDEVPSQYQEPVQTKITGFFGNQNYINFMFPTIIITILMWISVFLSSVAFIKQRNQGILKRMSVSPTGTSSIIVEKILVYTIISLIFLPLIFLLGYFGFGIETNIFNIIPITTIYAIASVIFVMQGLIIGCITRSENAATLSSLMIVIPMMFLSGTFFPQESLPSPIKWLTPYMPINISVSLIEGFYFYEFSVIHILMMLGRLFLYLFAYGLIAWLLLLRNIKK